MSMGCQPASRVKCIRLALAMSAVFWASTEIAVPAHAQNGSPAQTDAAGNTILLQRKPFVQRTSTGDEPFSRIELGTIGIYRPVEFSMKDHWPPFWEARGVASGDLDNDGDDDIVLGSTDRGLSIHMNDGSGKFVELPGVPANISRLPIFNVAAVDLNNDGWLDLVFTTYQ